MGYNVYDITIDKDLIKALNRAQQNITEISKKEAQKVVRELNKATKIYYGNLENAKTPAQLGLSRQRGASPGEFVKPKDIGLTDKEISQMSLNELKNEIRINRDFLMSETSTYQGYREYQERISRTLENNYREMTTRQQSQFWQTYNKLKDLSSNSDFDSWALLDSGERAKLVWAYQHDSIYDGMTQEEKNTAFLERINSAYTAMLERQDRDFR